MRSLFMKLMFLVLMTQVVFSATTLTSGVSKNSSVSQGSWKYYKISASSSSTVTVKLTELSADVDLYVRKNSLPTDPEQEYLCRPYEGGTTSETCNNISMGSTDVMYIGVYGYENGSFKVKATTSGGSSSGGSSTASSEVTYTTLTSGDLKNGSASYRSWTYYRIDSNGASNLAVAMTELSADVDLYVRKNSLPTDPEQEYLCRPYEGGTTSETCNNISMGSTDVMYIGVYGYENGSFKVKATTSGGSSNNNSSSTISLLTKEFISIDATEMKERYRNSLIYYNAHKNEFDNEETNFISNITDISTIFDNNALGNISTVFYLNGWYNANDALNHFLSATGNNLLINIESSIQTGGVRKFVYNTIVNKIDEGIIQGTIEISQMEWGSDNNLGDDEDLGDDEHMTYGTFRIEWETDGTDVVLFVNDIYSFDIKESTIGRRTIPLYKNAADLVLSDDASDFYFIGRTGRISINTIRERASDDYVPNGDSVDSVDY